MCLRQKPGFPVGAASMIGAHQISQNIPKLTPMARFPNRTGSCKKDVKSNNFLKLNGSVFSFRVIPEVGNRVR